MAKRFGFNLLVAISIAFSAWVAWRLIQDPGGFVGSIWNPEPVEVSEDARHRTMSAGYRFGEWLMGWGGLIMFIVVIVMSCLLGWRLSTRKK